MAEEHGRRHRAAGSESSLHFVRVPSAALGLASPAAFKVLAALCSHLPLGEIQPGKLSAEVWPSRREIARRSRLSLRHVDNSLADLKASGLVEVTEHQTSKGNRYRVNFPVTAPGCSNLAAPECSNPATVAAPECSRVAAPECGPLLHPSADGRRTREGEPEEEESAARVRAEVWAVLSEPEPTGYPKSRDTVGAELDRLEVCAALDAFIAAHQPDPAAEMRALLAASRVSAEWRCEGGVDQGERCRFAPRSAGDWIAGRPWTRPLRRYDAPSVPAAPAFDPKIQTGILPVPVDDPAARLEYRKMAARLALTTLAERWPQVLELLPEVDACSSLAEADAIPERARSLAAEWRRGAESAGAVS